MSAYSTQADHLTITAQQRVRLASLIGVLSAGLVIRLPLAITTIAAAILAWQIFSASRGWRLPGFWLRSTLTAACFALVFATAGSVFGKQAGASLLLLMLALKISELRAYRDVILVLGLCCLLLVSEFLFSQQPWMSAYLVVGVFLITAGFVDANLGPNRQSVRATFTESLQLCLLALPVMALLFVFFPRISGSLWGSPGGSSQAARTGLSNHMSPGTISSVVRSNRVALRARFINGHAPPPNERYWRGPVLWHFSDGRWTTDPPHVKSQAPKPQESSRTRHVDITLTATHRHWLIALDHPLTSAHQYSVTPGNSLKAPNTINHQIEYRETSVPHTASPNAKLAPAVRAASTQLPAQGNPRARHLAKRWAKQTSNAQQLVTKALGYFRHHQFVYTLKPPPTGHQNSIDHFLFQTRRGFCAHYASAFTFLMRAAGQPARVVTGYLGGKPASIGNYWIVRNTSAHAWSEVWEPSRGWVRVDPTAAVAPGRIDNGVAGSVKDKADLPFMARGQGGLLFSAGLAWDAIHEAWTHFVLGYGPSVQKQVMAKLGLTSVRQTLITLALSITAVLALISIGMVWYMRPPADPDPVMRAWRKVKRRLRRANVPTADNEGPCDYAARVGRVRPDLAKEVNSLAQQFVRIRYAGANDTKTRRAFLRACAQFHPARKPPSTQSKRTRSA